MASMGSGGNSSHGYGVSPQVPAYGGPTAGAYQVAGTPQYQQSPAHMNAVSAQVAYNPEAKQDSSDSD